jgi:hypothetical protein
MFDEVSSDRKLVKLILCFQTLKRSHFDVFAVALSLEMTCSSVTNSVTTVKRGIMPKRPAPCSQRLRLNAIIRYLL